MFVSEISLWGAAIVACVVIVAMIALAVVIAAGSVRTGVIGAVGGHSIVVHAIVHSVASAGAERRTKQKRKDHNKNFSFHESILLCRRRG